MRAPYHILLTTMDEHEKAAKRVVLPFGRGTVATARACCLFPIGLCLLMDNTPVVAQWMSGPPERPRIMFGDEAIKGGFNSLLDAMLLHHRRKVDSPHVAVSARVSADDMVTTVCVSRRVPSQTASLAHSVEIPLPVLLDAVVGHCKGQCLYVSRNVPWVKEALFAGAAAAHALVAVDQRRDQETDVAQIMRRIDAIAINLHCTSGDHEITTTSRTGPGKESRGKHALDGAPDVRPHKRPRMSDDDNDSMRAPPLAPTPLHRPTSLEWRLCESLDTTFGSHDSPAEHETDKADSASSVHPGKSEMRSVHERVEAECSICLCDKGRVLWDRDRGAIATLDDLNRLSEDELLSLLEPADTDDATSGPSESPVERWKRLDDSVLVTNPCRLHSHVVCVRCIRALVTNTERPPLGYERATIGCLSIDGDARCPGTHYGQASSFDHVLDPPERRDLALLFERHRIVGIEMVACPHHIIVHRGTMEPHESLNDVPAAIQHSMLSTPFWRRGLDVVPCGALCPVDHALAARAKRGHVPVVCTQNPNCRGAFCYHCRARMPIDASVCASCTRARGRDDPDALNFYLCHPSVLNGVRAHAKWDDSPLPTADRAVESDGRSDRHLLRNGDITFDMALAQIERVLQSERVAQPCLCCGVPLTKSTQCNALTHCGVQKCFVCGCNTFVGGHLEAHHWDPTGRHGCPRFDDNWHSAFAFPGAPFRCLEGVCYNDVQECSVPEHEAGVRAMHDERRVWHVWGMLLSLPTPMCERVLASLAGATPDSDTGRRLLLERIRPLVLQR